MDFISKLIELFTTVKYWEMIFRGLKMTLGISLGAIGLGLLLGTVVALVTIAKKSRVMFIPKLICKIYITVFQLANF